MRSTISPFGWPTSLTIDGQMPSSRSGAPSVPTWCCRTCSSSRSSRVSLGRSVRQSTSRTAAGLGADSQRRCPSTAQRTRVAAPTSRSSMAGSCRTTSGSSCPPRDSTSPNQTESLAHAGDVGRIERGQVIPRTRIGRRLPLGRLGERPSRPRADEPLVVELEAQPERVDVESLGERHVTVRRVAPTFAPSSTTRSSAVSAMVVRLRRNCSSVPPSAKNTLTIPSNSKVGGAGGSSSQRLAALCALARHGVHRARARPRSSPGSRWRGRRRRVAWARRRASARPAARTSRVNAGPAWRAHRSSRVASGADRARLARWSRE